MAQATASVESGHWLSDQAAITTSKVSAFPGDWNSNGVTCTPLGVVFAPLVCLLIMDSFASLAAFALRFLFSFAAFAAFAVKL